MSVLKINVWNHTPSYYKFEGNTQYFFVTFVAKKFEKLYMKLCKIFIICKDFRTILKTINFKTKLKYSQNRLKRVGYKKNSVFSPFVLTVFYYITPTPHLNYIINRLNCIHMFYIHITLTCNSTEINEFFYLCTC